jgi:hypothetical protein
MHGPQAAQDTQLEQHEQPGQSGQPGQSAPTERHTQPAHERPEAQEADVSTRACVVVCAWCTAGGRAQAAVRPPDEWSWQPLSLAFARVVTLARLASHGICPDCLEREMAELAA